LPKSLFDGRGIDYVEHSFRVFTNESIYSNSKINHRYSDHLPIIAQFSTKPFTQSHKPNYQTKTIKDLYLNGGIDEPVIIKDATLIYKDRYGGAIKDNSRAIYIYTPNLTLQIGHSYDILVEKTKLYHSVLEITKFQVLQQKKASLQGKFLDIKGNTITDEHINEVIASIEGEYKNNKFFYSGGEINIYFQDKSKKPSKASKLRLETVRVTRYKGKLQITVSHASKVQQL